MKEIKVIQITEDGLDYKLEKQTEKILNTVTNNHTAILDMMSEYNKSLNDIRRKTDKNAKDIEYLQSARSFWIRCAIGFSGFVTFLILMWKLIFDRL